MAEFRRQTEAIRAAAREWAIRWQEPEGRFISSLLGAIEIVGRLTISVQSAIDAAAKESRTAAEAELAKARDLQQSAHLALMQARNLQLGAITEQENVTIRMIDQTLPLFVERLEKVLVIREQRWNTDVKRRRYAAAGAVVLAVFLRASVCRGGRTGIVWRRWISAWTIRCKQRGTTIAASTLCSGRRRMPGNRHAIRSLRGDASASLPENCRWQWCEW